MPALPLLPEGFVARPLSRADIADVAAVLADAEKVDDTGEHWIADELADFWAPDLVDLSRDGVAACTSEGRLVGYAVDLAPPTFRGAFRIGLEGRVHPDLRGRGIGRAMLDWQLRRGTEIHRERQPEAPGELAVNAVTTMPSLEGLLRRAGLAQSRWYFDMARPLTDLPSAPTPAGIELAPFDWARDDEVRRAHNAAFVEHHGSSERDELSWRTWFTGQRSFRPDLSVLALADGAVVGYVLTYVYESDTEATGQRRAYFGQIGVLPPARGQGLAKAAIAAALQVAAAGDCQSAGLQVDSANGSGALGLYERLGFATHHTVISWTRPLPPAV